MIDLLIAWLVMAVIVVVAAAIIPGVTVRSFGGALWVSLLFGLLNVAIGWLLFVVIGIGTLGLGFLLAFVTRWLVDAILLQIAAAVTNSFEIESFGKAFLAAMVMSGLGTLAEMFIRA
jgi:putative membrane protein